MKIIARVVLWLFILLVVIFFSVSLYLHYYGRVLISNALSRSLGVPVTMGLMYYQAPVGFHVYDVIVGDHLMVPDIRAQFEVRSLFARTIHFSHIMCVSPVVRMDSSFMRMFFNGRAMQSSAVPETDAATAALSTAPAVPVSSPAPAASWQIMVDQISIREGRILYLQDAATPLLFKGIQADIRSLTLPLGHDRMTVSILGQFVADNNPLSESRVEAKGWIDIQGRNMDVALAVATADGKGVLSAHAVAQNNETHVEGTVSINSMIMNLPGMAGKEKEDAHGVAALGILSSLGIDLGARFSFDTKMDDFQIGSISFSGSVAPKE